MASISKTMKSVFLLGIGVSVVFVTFLVILNIMYGRYYMVWMDEYGKDNGDIHEVLAAGGKVVFQYYCSDYGNTNHIYEIYVRDVAGQLPDVLKICVMKTKTGGKLICEGEVVLRYRDKENIGRGLWGELHPSFAPKSEDEILELMILPFGGDSDLAKSGLRIRLFARRFWAFPTA